MEANPRPHEPHEIRACPWPATTGRATVDCVGTVCIRHAVCTQPCFRRDELDAYYASQLGPDLDEALYDCLAVQTAKALVCYHGRANTQTGYQIFGRIPGGHLAPVLIRILRAIGQELATQPDQTTPTRKNES